MRKTSLALAVGSQLLSQVLWNQQEGLAAPLVQGESATLVLPLVSTVPLVLSLLLLLLLALVYSLLVRGPLLARPLPPEALEEHGL